MRIREPVVAGRFYAANEAGCRRDLDVLLQSFEGAPTGSDQLLGGLVPHAGWMCSGAVAAEVFSQLAASHAGPDVLVLFGGVHRYRGKKAALFGSGRWDTPLGPMLIDDRLTDRILGQSNLLVDDPYAHEHEHSLEVQMPFLARLFPKTKVVPVMVPMTPTAREVGEAVGRTLKAYKYDALIIGTTDLTHYGPGYHFAPHGTEEDGHRWAKEENDQRFIDLVRTLRDDRVVEEAMEHKNACSAGAVAATLAAVKALGATRAEMLKHTNSREVLGPAASQEMPDSVGYAGFVFS